MNFAERVHTINIFQIQHGYVIILMEFMYSKTEHIESIQLYPTFIRRIANFR